MSCSLAENATKIAPKKTKEQIPIRQPNRTNSQATWRSCFYTFLLFFLHEREKKIKNFLILVQALANQSKRPIDTIQVD